MKRGGRPYVPITPGDGDRPPKGLLSAFVVRLGKPKEPTVAREEAPRFVGIGWDQNKSTGDQLTTPWNSAGWCKDWERSGGHRLGDISRLGVVFEGAAQCGERFAKLTRFNCGGLGPRQSKQ